MSVKPKTVGGFWRLIVILTVGVWSTIGYGCVRLALQ